ARRPLSPAPVPYTTLFRSKAKKSSTSSDKSSSLMVRMEPDIKRAIEEAAALRRVSVSDYVRTVTVQQAEREVQAAHEGVLRLTPELVRCLPHRLLPAATLAWLG